MLDIFNSLFSVLNREIGNETIEQILKAFMDIIQRGGHIANLVQDKVGARVIAKFLGLLISLVSEPSSRFSSFIPSIVSICLDQIYPTLITNPVRSSDFFLPSPSPSTYRFKKILKRPPSKKQPELKICRHNQLRVLQAHF